MPTVNFNFNPGVTVFFITDDCELNATNRDEMLKPRIQEATVKTVGITIDEANVVTVVYTVENKTGDFSMVQTLETDTFADLNSALAEYGTRIAAL